MADATRKAGILTVAVVTKPFTVEGKQRTQMADKGVARLRDGANATDTVLVIPNRKLFRIADAKTTFADAFVIADRVLAASLI